MGVDIRRNGNKGLNKNDDLEVLLALKRNIFRELNVASLGQVKEIGETYKVVLFPTYSDELELTIECFKLRDLEITTGDVVLVLFLDRNFLQNLKQIKNNHSLGGGSFLFRLANSNLNRTRLKRHILCMILPKILAISAYYFKFSTHPTQNLFF